MEKLTSIKEEGLSQIEACEDLAQLQAACAVSCKSADLGSDEIHEGFAERGAPGIWSAGK